MLARAAYMELGSYECAKAAFDRYPLPNARAPFWSSGSGILVSKLCEEHGMPVDLLSVSAQAAALLLFDRQWQHDAHEYVAARLVRCTTLASAVDGLMALYQADNGGSRANARLQLMASKVEPLLFWPLRGDQVVAYMTYSPHGVHIHLSTVLHVPRPTTQQWAAVQDELTSQEQLECAVLSNCLSADMRAVAHGQPICMPFDKITVPLDASLRFCATCLTSGPVTSSGEMSGILVCPEIGCCHADHTLCCSLQLCPLHATPLVELILSATCPIVPTPLIARGIVECSATWCLLISDWAESAEHGGIAGLLHPASVDACVRCADRLTASGNWYTVDHDTNSATDKEIVKIRFGSAALPKRVVDVIMRTEALHAAYCARGRKVASDGTAVETRGACRIVTGESSAFMLRPPVRVHPEALSFGQICAPVPRCLRHITCLADALLGLQVYSEPEFSTMCTRFRGSTSPVDALLTKWMHLGLPLLPGTTNEETPALTAKEMHAVVAHGILSARTKARSDDTRREYRHWCVACAEPVLPVSMVDDALCLQKLGLPGDLPPAAVATRPPATPDVYNADDDCEALELGGYTCSAMRVLMNPSMHVLAVTKLQAVAAGAFTGTCLLRFLMHGESDPIPVALTAAYVSAFRAQCLRCSTYGRMFLLAIRNADAIGLRREPDPTGLLCCTQVTAENNWSGDWAPVRRLCLCTGASYVGLGAGSMRHWQQVAIAGRPSVLFEYDLAKLLRMPESLLAQELVHVVPCSWTGMVAADLPMQNAVCVMHREGLTPLPCSQDCATHTISIVPLALPVATQFAAFFRDSAWHMYCNPLHDAFAARASECLNAMNNT